MKIIYNDNSVRVLYNNINPRIVTKVVEVTKITNIPLNLTIDSFSLFWGSAGTLSLNGDIINFSYGSSRDYWYKINTVTLEPSTNYIVTATLSSYTALSAVKFIGARDGFETSKYDCNLGSKAISNLSNNTVTLAFTTPETLGETAGLMIGCLGNTNTSGGEIVISNLTLKKAEYKGLDHRNWLTIGDSITAGVGTTKTYREFICEDTGLIDNGDSRISGGSVTLIGDGTLSGSGFTYMPDFVNYSAQEKYLRPILITIWLGTNDHIGNAPIGTEDSTDVTTFWGALNYFLPKLKESYPNADILYFTPAKKRTMTANTAGYTLQDYIAVIKLACAKYEIPLADLYTDTYDQLDINTMTADGLHFNITGHETVIAPYIESKIKEYFL